MQSNMLRGNTCGFLCNWIVSWLLPIRENILNLSWIFSLNTFKEVKSESVYSHRERSLLRAFLCYKHTVLQWDHVDQCKEYVCME